MTRLTRRVLALAVAVLALSADGSRASRSTDPREAPAAAVEAEIAPASKLGLLPEESLEACP